jgi:glycosyltransferase involved in cell wall biosynthesis
VTTIHDVLWFHVKSNYDSKIKYKLKTRAIVRAAEKSDLIIVPFQSTKDFLVDEIKISADRIKIVPYGVDHSQFFPLKKDETPKKPDFFPATGRNILFVGALNFGKGVDTLLKAFVKVAKEVSDVNLVLGSGGWNKSHFVDEVESHPYHNRIKMTGFIPESELRNAYMMADITCFPSRYGFGLPTLESMACGTPTVSGRTLDAPEFIGDAGLMSDPNDPEELADQLIRVLTDSTLYDDLIKKGLQKSSEYRWQRTVDETIACYKLLDS